MSRLIVLLIITLVGCRGPQGVKGSIGPVGPSGPAAPSPAPLTSIQSLVAAQNAYRASVGQEPLTQGLDCNLYTVPTTTIQISGATLINVGAFEYTGAFNQPNADVTAGLNVLPVNIQSVFQTWYIIKCTGQFVLADDAWHSYSLTSDDGSLLSINGSLINNDGLHSATTVNAVKLLEHGLYSFELDYLQGTGQEQLNLDMDGSTLTSDHFYH